MKDTILAISGKPGLYRLVAGGKNLIVETIDAQRRRIPASSRDHVTSLGDVTMYTESDDVALTQVFQNISDALKGAPTSFTHKSASDKELKTFMTEIALPAWDRLRVRVSDIRKLVQWYNILVSAGYTQFVTPAEDDNTEVAASAE